MNLKQSNDQYSKAETARRRDAIIKNMIATPPQKHKPLGKKKASRPKSANQKKHKNA
jgi:hypothetical protein